MNHATRRLTLVASLLVGCVLFAGCSKDVTIGAVVSESGNVAPYGESVKRGVDLAADELNAAGGINGGAVTIAYRDDGSDPQRAKAALGELIAEGVRVVIGGMSSDATLAMAPIAEEAGVVMLSPSSSAPAVTDAGEFIFRNYPSDILEGTAMADFARHIGLKTVVIFAIDNEYGNGLKSIFSERFESKSRSVVETFTVHQGAPGDVDAMVARTKELDPDGVYLVTYVNETAQLLKKLRGAGIEAVMMTTASYTPQLPREAGEAAENLVYPQPVFDIESGDEHVAEFIKAYQSRYGELPDTYAAHGYDALNLIAEAMRRTESKHPDDVKRGLLGLESYPGVAGLTQFDKNGDVVRRPRMYIVRAGQPLLWDIFEEQGGELPGLGI